MKKEKLARPTKCGLLVILGLCITLSMFLSGCGSKDGSEGGTKNETRKSPQQQADERLVCINKLKQIEMAMHNYCSAKKTFPPAYTTDASGKPLHSWRTLILPYMEEYSLYKKLKLDEPWNSPHNLAVFENNPIEAYQCPSDDQGDLYRTNYVMIVGPNFSPTGRGWGFKKLARKGTSNTGHITETTVPIKWYEPKDLKAEEISFKINDKNSPGIGSNHPGAALVGFYDGSVHVIEEDTPPEKLRGLFDVTDTTFTSEDLEP